MIASLATMAGFSLVAPLSPLSALAALSVFFITGGGNAINDYFDRARDKVNKPYRPLPSGTVAPRTALALTAALFSLGLACAMLVSMPLLNLAAVVCALLVIYSGAIKEFKIVGNALVSVMVGLTFIAGSLAAGSWQAGVPLAILAAIVNWSREIFKDLEEKSPEKWTLAAFIGRMWASLAATGLAILGVIAGIVMSLTFTPVRRALFTGGLIALALVSVYHQRPERAQQAIKAGMGLIILGLLLQA